MAGKLVALALPRAELPDALEEVWAAGDAALPLDPAQPASRREELLARLGAGDRVAPGVALVVATSGTTGEPKGVELEWSALDAAAALTNAAVRAGAGDRWLCCLPPSGIGGLMTLVRSRALGTRAVVHERFSPEAVAAERGAQFVSIVPAMLARLVELDVDLSHFNVVLVGGDRAEPDLVRRARGRVVTTYGMTETCGGVVYDGVPLPGVEITLAEDGAIAIGGPTIMRGYRFDEPLAGRPVVTADRGELDANGRLRVLGRVDEVIVSAGNKIAPRAVERVLQQHPSVLYASVGGVPDDELGRRVVARIVVRAGATAPTLDDVRELVAEHLGRHHAPRELVVEDMSGARHQTGPTER